jgi:hypothetical protein
VSITRLFIAGVIPGLMLALLFMGYTVAWSLLHPERIPPADATLTFGEKLYASRHLIPVVGLDRAGAGLDLRRASRRRPRPRRSAWWARSSWRGRRAP